MRRITASTTFILAAIWIFGQSNAILISAQQLIDNAVAENQCVGIAAGFSIDGKIYWEGGAGTRDKDRKEAFDRATLTRIASITKPMTAVAILQLYERGELDLDKSVRAYLPWFPSKKMGDITVRHLLQHSSGIDGYQSDKERENKKNYASLEDAATIFKDRELLFKPGTDFTYTSYGYVLLGCIIEKISGLSYGDYLRINIWEKAGMTQTGIEDYEEAVPGKSILYHRNSKGKIKAAKATNLSDRIPAGGVYSCLTDILKFGDAVLNYSLISEVTSQMMWDNSNLKKEGSGYGMGWYLYGKNADYGNVVGHTGAQTGVSAFLMLLPDQKISAVVLSNTSGSMQRVSDIVVQLFKMAGGLKSGVVTED